MAGSGEEKNEDSGMVLAALMSASLAGQAWAGVGDGNEPPPPPPGIGGG